MSNPMDEEWDRATSRTPPRVARVVGAMRVDLSWLHAAWMALAFGEGLASVHSVVEDGSPQSTGGRAAYRLWAALGLLFLLVAYPVFVLSLAVRYYAQRLDRLSAGLGVAGVVVLSALVWGVLSAATFLSAVTFEGFLAVTVAGGVATVSAALARAVTRRGGRGPTVAVGYPLAVTALFLPPVVASLYSPTLASVVFPSSESLAIWLLDNVLQVGGLAEFIRASFELEGLAYVGMWFGLAVPTGWTLGGLVTLAGRARTGDEDADVGPY